MDYGALVLLDSRYAGARQRVMLPGWVQGARRQRHVKDVAELGPGLDAIGEFFAGKEAEAEPRLAVSTDALNKPASTQPAETTALPAAAVEQAPPARVVLLPGTGAEDPADPIELAGSPAAAAPPPAKRASKPASARLPRPSSAPPLLTGLACA
jgi:hypothetical protein